VICSEHQSSDAVLYDAAVDMFVFRQKCNSSQILLIGDPTFPASRW